MHETDPISGAWGGWSSYDGIANDHPTGGHLRATREDITTSPHQEETHSVEDCEHDAETTSIPINVTLTISDQIAVPTYSYVLSAYSSSADQPGASKDKKTRRRWRSVSTLHHVKTLRKGSISMSTSASSSPRPGALVETSGRLMSVRNDDRWLLTQSGQKTPLTCKRDMQRLRTEQITPAKGASVLPARTTTSH